MKTKILIPVFLLFVNCNNTIQEGDSNVSCILCDTKEFVKILENEPVIVRKNNLTQEEMQRYESMVDSFAFELQTEYVGISPTLIPCNRIPEKYRVERMSITVSGNITNCLIGHSEPDGRFMPQNIIEIKLIK